MQLNNNTILITGGGSGIGLRLTERFLQEGNIVIICGRRQEVLEEVKRNHPALITYGCDLADKYDRIRLSQQIMTEHPDVNVLINNAGIQQWTSIADDDFIERSEQEIEININAPVHLCALFSKMPALKTIINITSGLAFTPLTTVPVYSATKAFFHSFTLSLQHLLKQQGIEVIEIIPPALNTDLGGKGLHDQAPPVSGFIESVFDQLKEKKTTITYGFSTGMLNAGPEDLKKAFERMNGKS